jgi:predicted porin
MKKTLIAMAVLATAGVASAEVTLYGRLDLGVIDTRQTITESIKQTITGSNTTVDATVNSATTKVQSLAGAQSKRTTSRLGVTGTENLGNGLTAFFNYEFKLEPDNTGSNGVGGTRLANLGLKGGFGEIKIGTFLNDFDTITAYTPATFSIGGGDFFYNLRQGNYLKSVNFASYGNISTFAVQNRSTNALNYTSPSFNGFTVGAVVSAERSHPPSDTDSRPVTTIRDDKDTYILSVNYNEGPLKATFVYGDQTVKTVSGVNTATPTDSGIDTTDIALAVKYDLGIAVPYVGYEQIEYKSTGTNVIDPQKTKLKGWEIGSSFPMGAFTPYLVFSMGDFDTPVATNQSYDADVDGWQLGTTYDLSKRTSLYASYGQDKSKYELRTTNGTTTTVGTQEVKNKGFALGLIHKF